MNANAMQADTATPPRAGEMTRPSPRLAVVGGFAAAGLTAAYTLVLAVGLLTLPSPGHPIQDPWFTLMELLILGIGPAIVAFCIGLHAWVPASNRAAAAGAIVFMCMCATVTACVHFSILTLARQPSFQSPDWASAVFAFQWPSVVYALDILAWDLFFPIGAACTGLALRGLPGLRAERRLFHASAALALMGLAGVPLADMSVRNVGIVGYALVFPAAVALLARKLNRIAQGATRSR
jgi:hypothetical protein